MDAVLGWDIGGAHLKAALLDGEGRMLEIYQEPCPLWQGMDKLEQAVQRIVQQIPEYKLEHAVTMTGELVDLFKNREQGVNTIIDTMQAALDQMEMKLYAAPGRFISSVHIKPADYLDIASANWLASLNYCADKIENALFVDIGSTTSDVLVIKNYKAEISGYTDYQRLCTGELLYTGIVRTPVMAISQQTQFDGKSVRLMAELFATMADVYRLTGELNEMHDQAPAADGGPKTELASALRLSRMIGCDFEARLLPKWHEFARHLRTQQLQLLQNVCDVQLERADFSVTPTIVGAGVGRFLVRALAKHFGYPYQDFNQIFACPTDWTGLSPSDCAPAAAVAGLSLKY